MNVNEKLRKDSGSVNIAGRLVGFLYDLMKDHIVPGKIEELVRDSEKFDNKDVNYFSNGWLAKYAENIADRLKNNNKYVLYYNNLNNQIEKIIEDQNFNKIVGFIQSHEKYKNLNYVIQFPCKSFYNIDINIHNKNEIILSKFDN
jgi:hypothetical protein